ncbi:MAG: helicase-exonuclease AddAB subunit AddA [Eubacteriales bacterium]|nr:helicase-exonuclease AddAB subunit AddA [Eubacteriales bacterium]
MIKAMKWTDEQKMAIDSRDKNLLVSAAAGSGKTAVLVERIIQTVIHEKVNLDRLLVVTFTNAAAGSMKEKIQTKINEAILNQDIHYSFLKKQMHLIHKSHISTIHSFCFNVLRKYFYLIDIDPGFRVMDTNDSNIMLNEIIEEVLERHYEKKDPDYVRFVGSYAENRGDSLVTDIIYKTYKILMSYPEPFTWFDDAIAALDTGHNRIEDTIWMSTIKKEARKHIEFAYREIQHAMKICPEDMPYRAALIKDNENITGLLNNLDNDFEKFRENLTNISHERLKSVSAKNQECFGIELTDTIKAKRQLYKDVLDKTKGIIPQKSLRQLTEDINEMHPTMKVLSQIIKEVSSEFHRKKLSKKCLDFNDAEHLTLSVLKYDEAANYYKDKFKYIYIDEYQDSNGVQEEIINRIKRDNNVFMVGDVKQSIYRFRQADPTLFIDKYNLYRSENDTYDNKLVLLNRNFRSRPEILDFINDIFQNIMHEDCGEIDYDADSFLLSGDVFEKKEDSVEINVLEKRPVDELDEELQELKTNQLEASFIVSRIKELVGDNSSKIKYMDIVILLRSAARWSSVFEEVFFDNDIPLYSDISSSYFDTMEIKVMINLLRLLDNSKQDIPLLSVMKSHIGGFSIDELIRIRVIHPINGYHEAIHKYTLTYDDYLSEKIKGFLSRINDWKWRSRHTKLGSLIWEILTETNYYYFNGMLPNGNMRQGNLRLLADRAGIYEAEGNTGIFDFIAYLEKIGQSYGDMSTAKLLGENDNVVRLMTIHKSKGLEFPIVICAGLSKRFNMTDLNDQIIISKKCLVAPKFIDPEKRIFRETLPRYASKIQMRNESISEEMRVLYVALTRAIDKLILVGTVNSFEKWVQKCTEESCDYYHIVSKRNYFDWIGIVLMNHYPDRYSVKRVSITDIESVNAKNKPDEYTSVKRELEKTIINTEMITMFDKRFNWEYKHKKNHSLPGKITVTDIKNINSKNQNEFRYKIPFMQEVPLFRSKILGFTPAEIGTITHSVLQLIRLKDPISIDYINEFVEGMVKRKQLTEEEAKVVETDKIFNFYCSELGSRMLKSNTIKREQPFILKKSIREILQTDDDDSEEFIYVQGIIDCYFYEDNEIVLIDYKTDRTNEDGVDELLDRYKMQIQTYREALDALTGKRVKESYLYLLNISKAVRID